MPSEVVTAASSGIGWGTTTVLLQHGLEVFGSVRKQEDTDRPSARWGKAFTFLLLGITNEQAVRHAATQVADRLQGHILAGSVNNAVIAVPFPLIYLPIGSFRHQLEVSPVGLLIVTQAFVVLLRADHQRQDIRSDCQHQLHWGKIAGPFLGAYHASKFGLEGFSDSLCIELMVHGIDVTVMGLGAVAASIWDRAERGDISAYQRSEYLQAVETYRTCKIENGREGYAPERLREVFRQPLTTSHPAVRYSYAVVPHSLASWIVSHLLPKRRVNAVIANQSRIETLVTI